MSPSEIITMSVAVATVVTVFLQYRRQKRTEERAAEAKERELNLAANDAGFDSAMRLQEYVDKRVDAGVVAGLAPYVKKLEELAARETRRTRAMSRILRAIAAQLPPGMSLRLDPADVAELEDTIPSQWLNLSKEI